MRLICMFLLVVGFSVTASLFVVCHYVSSNIEPTEQAFLIFNTKINQWGFLSLQYRRQVIFASYLLPIIFAVLSIRALNRQAFTMSHKARKMLDDFSMTLYVKNIAPTFMIFIPLLVRYATDFYKVQSWVIDEFVTTMYSWLPFINAVSTLVLIIHTNIIH
ncbi:hypothetical protein M3Y96_00937600 [Aphelenchoides besseyi]|nr:hypothetical protein M3Y96_00937600 [Aphelenchoides besseyi]